MKFCKERLVLYVIVHKTDEKTFLKDIEDIILGGATIIQLREKDICEDDFLKEAIKVKKLCKKYGIGLIINDNINVAVKSGADGVHLGQNDLDIKKARKILGEGKIIGATAKTVFQAKQAQADGADYIGSGAVFTSQTKKDAVSLSLEKLKEIIANVSIPIVAIGGINENNILNLKGTKICGVALSNTILSSSNKKDITKKLYNLSKEVIKG